MWCPGQGDVVPLGWGWDLGLGLDTDLDRGRGKTDLHRQLCDF